MESFVVAKMVTLLFTSLFVLALLAIAAYFWQKPTSPEKIESLEPAPGRALFHEGTPSGRALAAADAEVQDLADAQKRRREVIDRAIAGDKTALQETQNNHSLYQEVLCALVANAHTDAALLSLVSYVTRNDLRVNKELAETFITSLSAKPDRGSVAKMLHVVALSDDAALYQKAAETALESWRKGHLAGVNSRELRSILDGEFWILSAATRSSGAGFLLKRALAGARRELDAAHLE